MSWKLRHEGSPNHIENLTLDQVADGVRDGLWEPTDEVMGPGERGWTAVESHPALSKVAEEAEEARRRPPRDEETQVDMVPLIDVCMVLLVFFILATTCQALERVLNLPDPGGRGAVVDPQEPFLVTATVGKTLDGRPFFAIDDQPLADEARIADTLRRLKTARPIKLVIRDRGADWGDVVKVIDAAGEVGIAKVFFDVSASPPPP